MTEGRGSRVTGRGYQQLRAWQKAHALALATLKATDSFRSSRRWLADQASRSAVSVAANIAEGYNRGSVRDYVRFLTISRGSLAETEYYLLFIQDIGLLPTNQIDELLGLVDDTGNLLFGLIRSLQAKDSAARRSLVRESRAFYPADDERNDRGPAFDHDPQPATPNPRPATHDPRPMTPDPLLP